ncbi:hypothetical protein PR048_025293 [Dryococelus australis]|uniref:DUF5641 domain-containing protein n=1 Tax=Dryococelus australis TaxID=614101 RepID=A0ABQ9GQY7_9NEOP|nr:hypothetical protein PR048_025293 [Dryococelus australis]
MSFHILHLLLRGSNHHPILIRVHKLNLHLPFDPLLWCYHPLETVVVDQHRMFPRKISCHCLEEKRIRIKGRKKTNRYWKKKLKTKPTEDSWSNGDSVQIARNNTVNHQQKTGFSAACIWDDVILPHLTLVLTGSDDSKMIRWPLGRVEGIIHGRDGKFRVFQRRTSTGTIIHPLQRVFLLEVYMGPVEPAVDKTKDNKGGVAQSSDSPSCPAAVASNELRQTRCGRLTYGKAVLHEMQRQLAAKGSETVWSSTRLKGWGKREIPEKNTVIALLNSHVRKFGSDSAGNLTRLALRRSGMPHSPLNKESEEANTPSKQEEGTPSQSKRCKGKSRHRRKKGVLVIEEGSGRLPSKKEVRYTCHRGMAGILIIEDGRCEHSSSKKEEGAHRRRKMRGRTHHRKGTGALAIEVEREPHTRRRGSDAGIQGQGKWEIRHDSHIWGSAQLGIEPGSPWCEASGLTTAQPRLGRGKGDHHLRRRKGGGGGAHTVEVDGAGAVSVDLGDDTVQVLGPQLVVQRRQDLPQRARRDVAITCRHNRIPTVARRARLVELTFSVVEPEGLLQLLLHSLGVVLLEEVRRYLAEAVESPAQHRKQTPHFPPPLVLFTTCLTTTPPPTYHKRATVAERLARSPPTEANRVQSPAGSPDFRKGESYRTMPLVGGFSRGSPVSPVPSFRRRSIFTSITLIGSLETSMLRAVQITSLRSFSPPPHPTHPFFLTVHHIDLNAVRQNRPDTDENFSSASQEKGHTDKITTPTARQKQIVFLLSSDVGTVGLASHYWPFRDLPKVMQHSSEGNSNFGGGNGRAVTSCLTVGTTSSRHAGWKRPRYVCGDDLSRHCHFASNARVRGDRRQTWAWVEISGQYIPRLRWASTLIGAERKISCNICPLEPLDGLGDNLKLQVYRFFMKIFIQACITLITLLGLQRAMADSSSFPASLKATCSISTDLVVDEALSRTYLPWYRGVPLALVIRLRFPKIILGLLKFRFHYDYDTEGHGEKMLSSRETKRGGTLTLHSEGHGFDSRFGHPDFGSPWFPEISPEEFWHCSLLQATTDQFPDFRSVWEAVSSSEHRGTHINCMSPSGLRTFVACGRQLNWMTADVPKDTIAVVTKGNRMIQCKIFNDNVAVPDGRPSCVGAAVMWWVDYSPPTCANWVRFLAGLHPNFRTSESCRTTLPVGGSSRGISRFPRPCIPALLHTDLSSPSSAVEGHHSTPQPISCKRCVKGLALLSKVDSRSAELIGASTHHGCWCGVKVPVLSEETRGCLLRLQGAGWCTDRVRRGSDSDIYRPVTTQEGRRRSPSTTTGYTVRPAAAHDTVGVEGRRGAKIVHPPLSRSVTNNHPPPPSTISEETRYYRRFTVILALMIALPKIYLYKRFTSSGGERQDGDFQTFATAMQASVIGKTGLNGNTKASVFWTGANWRNSPPKKTAVDDREADLSTLSTASDSRLQIPRATLRLLASIHPPTTLLSGATVAERLDCSPPNEAHWVQSPAGSIRISARRKQLFGIEAAKRSGEFRMALNIWVLRGDEGEAKRI